MSSDRLLRRLLCGMALLAFIAAGGCTPWRDYFANGFKVGPEYRRPAAPVAKDWIDRTDIVASKSPESICTWWRVLNDPTLDSLVTNAYQQNLTLREAGFRVLQARAARAIAAGFLFPQQQDIAGDYQRIGISSLQANSQFLPQRFYDQWDLGFNLAWELDFWGRFRRALESADADLDASVENYDQVLVTLIGDVAATYVEIRTLQQQIFLVQTNVGLQRETYNIANARFKGGQVSSLDVDQAVSNLAQTEALVPQLGIRLRQATNRLCILMGMPPEELLRQMPRAPIPVAPPDIAIGIPADLLTQRPDVRRTERLAAAQCALVGVATSELYPHIGVSGTLGYTAQNFSDLLKGQALQGAVGPYFQWNVLHYGRLLNEIRRQDALLAELIVSYQNTVLKANAEAEDGLARYLGAQQATRFLAVSVNASQKATDVALVQYKAGMIDFNRVALIEQNLVDQQNQLAESQGSIAQGLVQVYRSLGGGWQLRLNPSQGTAPGAAPAAVPTPAGRQFETVPAPVPLPPAPAVPAPNPLLDPKNVLPKRLDPEAAPGPVLNPQGASLQQRPQPGVAPVNFSAAPVARAPADARRPASANASPYSYWPDAKRFR
ncbi:MAG: TolC family protein [Planctomycetes bacterium]|nr:TolC family protein [Planctomycetota bacterium]